MGLWTESLQMLYLKHKVATEVSDGKILRFVKEEDMLLISDVFKGNKEDLDYLIELGKELKTQDNLGTRKPLIFRIQDVRRDSCEKGLEDFRKIDISDNEGSFHLFYDDKVKEAVAFIKREYGCLDSTSEFDDLIEFCEMYGIKYKVYYYRYENYYTGEFLTGKAARKYLEKYKEEFNDAKVYIDCGAENEELTRLTEVLERLYEMNCKEELRCQS